MITEVVITVCVGGGIAACALVAKGRQRARARGSRRGRPAGERLWARLRREERRQQPAEGRN
jgi:hypothetical protein